MKPSPPDSQDAGHGMPAARSEEMRLDVTHSTPRRRFTFDFARTQWATMITLSGELDVVCSDAFKRRFAEATDDDPERIVIDLRDLTFIDSTGLALLLRVRDLSQDVGFELWMIGTETDPTSRIFRMTGTNTILPIVASPPDFS
jgi:anti-sigma B factor antagonist